MTFAREELLENRAELEPIFTAHWQDVKPDFGNVSLGFDWETYAELERTGQVHFMVARENGHIAGYQCCIARRHMHSQETQVATTAFFFMLPEYRKGWTGVRLFQETERSLAGLGVRNIYTGTKTSKNIAPILRRLGYHEVESVFAKEIACTNS